MSAVPTQVLTGEGRTLDSDRLRSSLGLDGDPIPVRSSPRPPADSTDGQVLSVGGTRFGLEDAGQVIRSTLDLHWTMPDESQGVFLSLRDRFRWGLQTARWLEFPSLAMAAVPSLTGGGDRFSLGAGRRPEVWVIEADTESVSTIGWEADLSELTEEHRALYLEHLVATAARADAEARHRTFLEQTPLPERMPAYGALRADRDLSTRQT